MSRIEAVLKSKIVYCTIALLGLALLLISCINKGLVTKETLELEKIVEEQILVARKRIKERKRKEKQIRKARKRMEGKRKRMEGERKRMVLEELKRMEGKRKRMVLEERKRMEEIKQMEELIIEKRERIEELKEMEEYNRGKRRRMEEIKQIMENTGNGYSVRYQLDRLKYLEDNKAAAPMEMEEIREDLEDRMELPNSHLWDALFDAEKEPTGYAMYTYVLIKQNKANTAAWRRYKKLVKSIMLSTTAVTKHFADFDRSLYNLFLIPHIYIGHQNPENLNDKLSKSILTSIAASVQNPELRKLINTNPGPFLISATEPISNKKLNKDIEMLYVDLTRTNLDAMPEVVAAYKKRLISDSIEGLERFNSIKMVLLNLILDGDDYISIIKVACAGWI